MIRLFAGIEIPAAVAERLTFMQGGVPGARWAVQENFHITLRFIGEVPENVARDIDDVLSAIRPAKFDILLEGAGVFGGTQTRALWAGVRANESLMHLQRKIEVALQRIGLEADPHRYMPHVTLAYLKGAQREKVTEYLTHHALFATPPFQVERFVLFSSQLSPHGSHYAVESTYDLA